MTDRTRPPGRAGALLTRIREGDAPTLIAIAALGLTVVSLLYSGANLNDYFASRDDGRAQAEVDAVAATRSSAASVDELLSEIAGSVDSLAGELSAGMIDDELERRLSPGGNRGSDVDGGSCSGTVNASATDLELRLCSAAAAIPELNGIGVLFDPAIDPGTVYRPYANRITGSLELGELSPRDPLETDWYVAAIRSGGAWTHPRFGSTSGTLLAIYSGPFYEADGSLRGVVIASYTLDQLADDLRLLRVGATGYSIILSDRALLLSHPEASRVEDAFREDPQPATGMVAALQSAVAADPAQRGITTGLMDDVTETAAWLAYEPIPSVGWTYGAVVIEREMLGRTDEQTRSLMAFSLGVLAAASLLAVVLFRAHRGSHRGLWAVSSTVGVLALVGIGAVWYLTITGPQDRSITENTRDSSAVAAMDDGGGAEPVFAGVFVQSVEFTGANDVTVSGIAWQQQRSDTGDTEPPGFVLPEADEATFEEQYRESSGNLTRIGWAFTASLRQTFDYSRYPLDRETVWLRLWPADYETPGPLLPDITSYETLAPTTRPGIERDFVVEGWTLDASSFSFRDNRYNTNFGLRDLTGPASTELYFNVHLKRSFLDALMSQLIPLIVVAVLLFGVLIITTEGRIKGENFGFSTLAVLAYCAALFFVVIVSHNDLRSELQAQQVIYLEYFYFAAYAAILGVSANAIFVGSGRGGRIIEYRDNVIPSLLFWPVLNGSLLAVTVIAFY